MSLNAQAKNESICTCSRGGLRNEKARTKGT